LIPGRNRSPSLACLGKTTCPLLDNFVVMPYYLTLAAVSKPCLLSPAGPFPISAFSVSALQHFSVSPSRFRVLGVFRGGSPGNQAAPEGENSRQLA
jgi:hypothetical protein